MSELAVLGAFKKGTPLQQLLGTVLDELGGLDFVVEWAEEHPSEFMRLVAAASPTPQQAPDKGSPSGTHIHVHPALTPGPLDIEATVVAEG